MTLHKCSVCGRLSPRRSSSWVVICLLAIGSGWGLFPVRSEGADHPLVPAIQLAEASQKKLESVKDYTATFHKKELVNQKQIDQRMLIKVREEPFSVYMKYDKPNQGREVLFVDGQNKGQLLVHEGGVLSSVVGTLQFAPTSPQVMAENRHPITQVGISKMLETIIRQWQEEQKYDDVEVKYYPNAKINQHPCQAIETSHSQQRPEFKFQLTRLYLDKETQLPIRVEQYAWPSRPGDAPRLVELYMYSNLQPNVGLTHADFDRKNRKYSF